MRRLDSSHRDGRTTRRPSPPLLNEGLFPPALAPDSHHDARSDPAGLLHHAGRPGRADGTGPESRADGLRGKLRIRGPAPADERRGPRGTRGGLRLRQAVFGRLPAVGGALGEGGPHQQEGLCEAHRGSSRGSGGEGPGHRDAGGSQGERPGGPGGAGGIEGRVGDLPRRREADQRGRLEGPDREPRDEAGALGAAQQARCGEGPGKLRFPRRRLQAALRGPPAGRSRPLVEVR